MDNGSSSEQLTHIQVQCECDYSHSIERRLPICYTIKTILKSIAVFYNEWDVGDLTLYGL